VRRGLVILLSVAVCAIAAGARSFVAIAEWAGDLSGEAAAALGIGTRAPSESAVCRLVQRVDPDRFDTVIGAGSTERHHLTGRDRGREHSSDASQGGRAPGRCERETSTAQGSPLSVVGYRACECFISGSA
jgi:hypothetical protein